MSDTPKGWSGNWKDTRGVRGLRVARVFFSSNAWSLHRSEVIGEVTKRTRHDSRANAIRVGQQWLKGQS